MPGKTRVDWTIPPAGIPNSLPNRRTTLESSTDLKTWKIEGSEVVGGAGGRTQAAEDVPMTGSQKFFRVRINDNPSFLASDGSEVFGYGTALSERLSKNTGITPGNFSSLYPSHSLSGVSFDVSAAEYFSAWNADPAVWNASPAGATDPRLTDFRLDPASLQKLQSNGFVVNEPRGAVSFTELYYRIWTDDLPVYVTSDSILHAWHRTWITMLEEIEELALRPKLVTLLGRVGWQVNFLGAGQTALAPGLADVGNFLTTASTLSTHLDTPVSEEDEQDPLTGFPLRAVNASGVLNETLFGDVRAVDWSQFGIRSHYANSDTLKAYFRAMMWLNLIDLRIDERTQGGSLAQLRAAVILTLAIQSAGMMDEWKEIDDVITAFTGRHDSMTPPQLLEILKSLNLNTAAAFTSDQILENLLVRIQTGQTGVQNISAHPIAAPLGESKRVLPRSFTFFGQRFTPESWAMGRMVFDKIWRENADPSGPPMVRVRRRLPSALDINFAVLGNDTPGNLLAQRMANGAGVAFRDGYDFSRELVSIREIMDSQTPDAWSGSVYLHQLAALRTLSAPLPDTVPQAMRTEAWKWKTVQTQLAGWTELRHDNLLYAKQSYTPPVLCFYPAGYVEPRPEFYHQMKRLVDFAFTSLAYLPVTGTYPGRPLPPGRSGSPVPVDIELRKEQWLTHLTQFAASLQTLTSIAQSEIDQVPFTTTQAAFLQSIVQSFSNPYSASGRTYSGWYPKMYLPSVFSGTLDPHPSEMWDPLVVDVHTDGPDVVSGDPGAVLYNATGNAALMLIAIDVNGQICLHGGPSFTYYEFTRPYGETRLNDQAWKTRVRLKTQPPHPEWTESWLTPGPINIPGWAN